MTTKEYIPLPGKPSDLLEIALNDLEHVRLNKYYEIDMNYWHYAPTNNPEACRVCFAGAVIARRGKFDHTAHVMPQDFDKETQCKLAALDQMRRGDFGGAFSSLGFTFEEGKIFDVPALAPYGAIKYRGDPNGFIATLRNQVEKLKTAGY